MHTPRDRHDLAEIIGAAAGKGEKLELVGGGSKAAIGAPREVTRVSLAALAGVVDYDPAELVLTVRPATPLADVRRLVAGQGQMLAFEPWDHGPLLGADAQATIGGVVAAGVAGSRRVTAGSARDHLLGFTAISGRGESFVAGAKVVKNVTGYDLPKLMAGSWGRLGAMVELTLKVLPRPRTELTLAFDGLSPAAAHAAMARALGSNAEVSAAAHLQSGLTLFRLAGFEPSVAARARHLPAILADHGSLRPLDAEEAAPAWHEAMTASGLSGPVLWRVHLQPAKMPHLLEGWAGEWACDWGGGLVWLATDAQDDAVRQRAAELGGEATLVRAGDDIRARVPTFQPRSSGVMALESRVRRAFDPAGVFETARFQD
jgi:glycolate oxidase FAD binding subunit